MNSKKPASDKRAAHPLRSDYTKAFSRDWSRLYQAGRHDLAKLKRVMLLLIANDGPLGPEWLDHGLQGSWRDHRECHVGGDFLLIYRVQQDTITFVPTGTHAELF